MVSLVVLYSILSYYINMESTNDYTDYTYIYIFIYIKKLYKNLHSLYSRWKIYNPSSGIVIHIQYDRGWISVLIKTGSGYGVSHTYDIGLSQTAYTGVSQSVLEVSDNRYIKCGWRYMNKVEELVYCKIILYGIHHYNTCWQNQREQSSHSTWAIISLERINPYNNLYSLSLATQ